MLGNIHKKIDSARRFSRYVLAEAKHKLEGFRCVIESNSVVPLRGCLFCFAKIENEGGAEPTTGVICSHCFEAIAETKEQCADWSYCPVCGAKCIFPGTVGTIEFFPYGDNDCLPDEYRPHGDFV